MALGQYVYGQTKLLIIIQALSNFSMCWTCLISSGLAAGLSGIYVLGRKGHSNSTSFFKMTNHLYTGCPCLCTGVSVFNWQCPYINRHCMLCGWVICCLFVYWQQHCPISACMYIYRADCNVTICECLTYGYQHINIL